MFERFDEPARRTLFFARYAASDLGSRSIESEHLLLGLIREHIGHVQMTPDVLGSLPLVDIRDELESKRSVEKVPTSVEIPFSTQAKRILAFAAEEADALQHRQIRPPHLLLGVLREDTSVAASTLTKYGARLDIARERLRGSSDEPRHQLAVNVVARAQIDQMIDLAGQLIKSVGDNPDVAMGVEFLQRDLQALKRMVDDAE